MVVSMGIDTVHTRTFRKLDQELTLLEQHKVDRAAERQLLTNPALNDIAPKPTLASQDARSVKNSDVGIEESPSRVSAFTTLSRNRPLVAGSWAAFGTWIKYLTAPIGQLIVNGSIAAAAFFLDAKFHRMDIPQLKREFRAEISDRRKGSAPTYNSIRELKDRVREQHIRTQTLREMSKLRDPSLMTQAEYKRLAVINTTRYDNEHQKPFAIALRRFLVDFFHSQQPFSDFNNLTYDTRAAQLHMKHKHSIS
jgi:hypothetical protein